jgi:hypothetical protein
MSETLVIQTNQPSSLRACALGWLTPTPPPSSVDRSQGLMHGNPIALFVSLHDRWESLNGNNYSSVVSLNLPEHNCARRGRAGMVARVAREASHPWLIAPRTAPNRPQQEPHGWRENGKTGTVSNFLFVTSEFGNCSLSPFFPVFGPRFPRFWSPFSPFSVFGSRFRFCSPTGLAHFPVPWPRLNPRDIGPRQLHHTPDATSDRTPSPRLK